MEQSREKLFELEKYAELLQQSINSLKAREAEMQEVQKAVNRYKFEFLKHFGLSQLNEITVKDLKNMVASSETWSGIKFIKAEVFETPITIEGRIIHNDMKFSAEIHQTHSVDNNAQTIKELKVEIDTDNEQMKKTIQRACQINSLSYVFRLLK